VSQAPREQELKAREAVEKRGQARARSSPSAEVSPRSRHLAPPVTHGGRNGPEEYPPAAGGAAEEEIGEQESRRAVENHPPTVSHPLAMRRHLKPPAGGGRAEAFTARVFTLGGCWMSLCPTEASSCSRCRAIGWALFWRKYAATPASIARRSRKKN